MPLIGSNSILDDNWFARLKRGESEGINTSIRNTGSRPDDSYWRAKEAEGLNDLSNQRNDALASLRESLLARQGANASAYASSEAARQKRITYGLSQNAQAGDYGAMVESGAPAGGAGMGGYQAPARAAGASSFGDQIQSAAQSPGMPVPTVPGGLAYRAAGSPVPVAVNPVDWAARMAPPVAAPAAAKPKKGVLSPQEQERQRIRGWLEAGSPMGQTNKDIEAYNIQKGKAGAGLTNSEDWMKGWPDMPDIEKSNWLKRYQEALISGMGDKTKAEAKIADARLVAANTAAAKTGVGAAKKKPAAPVVTPLEDKPAEAGPGYFSNYGKKTKVIGDWIGGLFGKSEPKALTANDQAAIAWANKNPADPRAVAIKKRLGVK